MRGLLVVGALCALTARASADGPTGGAGALGGAESPELQSLRLAEEELFDRVDAELRSAGHVEGGAVPRTLSSEVEPRPAAAPQADGDVRWLDDLDLPDVPVRWDERVVRFLRFFRDDPRGRQLMQGWLRREGRYGTLIRARLRERSLPEDLVYVAMVESGFQPTARSRAGAVGLWQFLRDDGRSFGLRIDHWVDERMDPHRSTEAGLRYLAQLYERFGRWELAFAAYNMGYGALLRAIRKYNTNDYWVLADLEAGLPFETTIYVAKIMACAIVARNPARFGYGDLTRDPPDESVLVDVDGGVPLGVIARAAGATTEELEALNPALRRRRTPPGGEASLRLTPAQAVTFAARWPRARGQRAQYATHVVRFGESLADVAYRYRTTEANLRALNALDEAEPARVGLDLLVPRADPRELASAEAPVVAVPPDRFSYPGRRHVYYRVVEGDTASEIARFFAVDLGELRQWNHLDERARLQRGMFLQLFVPEHVDLSRAVVLSEGDVRVLVVGSDEFFDYHETQRGRVRLRHRVAPGETVASIAARYGLSAGSVARINRFPSNRELVEGEEIIVYAPDPSRAGAGGGARAASPEPADPAPAEPDAPAEAPAADPTGERPDPADAAPAAEEDTARAPATEDPPAGERPPGPPEPEPGA